MAININLQINLVIKSAIYILIQIQIIWNEVFTIILFKNMYSKLKTYNTIKMDPTI